MLRSPSLPYLRFDLLSQIDEFAASSGSSVCLQCSYPRTTTRIGSEVCNSCRERYYYTEFDPSSHQGLWGPNGKKERGKDNGKDICVFDIADNNETAPLHPGACKSWVGSFFRTNVLRLPLQNTFISPSCLALKRARKILEIAIAFTRKKLQPRTFSGIGVQPCTGLQVLSKTNCRATGSFQNIGQRTSDQIQMLI